MNRPTRHALTLLLLALLVVGCAGGAETAAPAPPADPAPVRVDQGSLSPQDSLLLALADLLPDGEEAGVVVGILSGGERQVAVVGNPDFGPQTLFEYGSITKAMTGVLLAHLAQEGALDLDASINALLPAPLQDPKWARVTPAHLATHTSGLPRLPARLAPWWVLLQGNLNDPYAHVDRARLERMIADASPAPDPPAPEAYSNFGFALLGYLLAQAEGGEYAGVMADRLFVPLGMETAQVDGWASTQAAPPLKRNGSPGHYWHLNAFAGAGGVRASAEDGLSFLAASLAACAGSAPLDRANCTAQQSTGVPTGRRSEMGLGWIRTTVAEADPGANLVIWHNGGTGGFTTFLGFNPATGTGLLLLSNLSDFRELDELAINFLAPVR